VPLMSVLSGLVPPMRAMEVRSAMPAMAAAAGSPGGNRAAPLRPTRLSARLTATLGRAEGEEDTPGAFVPVALGVARALGLRVRVTSVEREGERVGRMETVKESVWVRERRVEAVAEGVEWSLAPVVRVAVGEGEALEESEGAEVSLVEGEGEGVREGEWEVLLDTEKQALEVPLRVPGLMERVPEEDRVV
jgi:hypothetical protein